MTSSDKMNDAMIKLAEKTANDFYNGFSKLPKELQINYVAIRVIQAVLGETLCQLASSRAELDLFLSVQSDEIKEVVKGIINGNPSHKEKFSKMNSDETLAKIREFVKLQHKDPVLPGIVGYEETPREKHLRRTLIKLQIIIESDNQELIDNIIYVYKNQLEEMEE